MTVTLPTLRIDEHLSDRHYGFAGGVAMACTEAARVCLDRHHQSPVSIDIDALGTKHAASLEWTPSDPRMQANHANEIDATAAGAYACVLAAVEHVMALVAIHRAETLVGADYYIAPIGSPVDDLEHALRLEISGVDRGSATTVRQRLHVKLEQAARGASNLPALAGIMGFKARLIMIDRVSEP